MSLTATVLFDSPQGRLAPVLLDLMERCLSLAVVVGFATPEGLRALEAPLARNPSRLSALTLGACTYNGFSVLDQLISKGVPPDRLRIHLGHSRPFGKSSTHRYHPMLHSKIYYFDMGDGEACAVVGSHNLTGFALLGLNGEASVMLEGSASDPEFEKIRVHMAEAHRQASPYDPSMKDAFTWWAGEYMNGLWRKVNDDGLDADTEKTKTIIIVVAANPGISPKKGEKVYFELPDGFSISSLANEAHIFVFDRLPASPAAALSNLGSARQSLWCKVEGLEVDKGGKELDADWEVFDRPTPRIRRAGSPFRPTPAQGMQQVRVSVSGPVRKAYEYIFKAVREAWRPLYVADRSVGATDSEAALFAAPEGGPSEIGAWQLVQGLEPVERSPGGRYLEALKQSSPESGSYVMVAQQRREMKTSEDH
jgi:hypothetical protein